MIEQDFRDLVRTLAVALVPMHPGESANYVAMAAYDYADKLIKVLDANCQHRSIDPLVVDECPYCAKRFGE